MTFRAEKLIVQMLYHIAVLLRRDQTEVLFKGRVEELYGETVRIERYPPETKRLTVDEASKRIVLGSAWRHHDHPRQWLIDAAEAFGDWTVRLRCTEQPDLTWEGPLYRFAEEFSPVQP